MKSVSHTKVFDLDRPVAELFPLFSPEGEKLWAPGWDYENIMGTTELSEDYVFLTRNHDHGAAEAIWIVKTYDPAAHLVEFYKIEPGHKVGLVTVKCSALAAAKTRIEVTYTYTALSVAGEAFIQGFGSEEYDQFINEWQQLLVDYIERKG